MDGDTGKPGELNAAHDQALDLISGICSKTKTESDFEQLVLAIDGQLEQLGFSFVSMTVNCLLDEDEKRFNSYIITASTELKRERPVRPRVYNDWKAGKVIHRRDLQADLEDLPPESLEKRRENQGLEIRATINIPFALGTWVIRSQEPDPFSDDQIELLLRIAHQISLAPYCAQ